MAFPPAKTSVATVDQDLSSNSQGVADLHRTRQDCLKEVSAVCSDVLGSGWSPQFFGSSVSGFGDEWQLPWPDLDIALCNHMSHEPRDGEFARDKLRSFAEALTNHASFQEVPEVSFFRKKVPFLKGLMFKGRSGNLKLDITVQNWEGIRNTKLLNAYSKLDPMVNAFIHELKAWAKSKGLRSADYNLSSYSWTLLGIFFLQVEYGMPRLPVDKIPAKDQGSHDNEILANITWSLPENSSPSILLRNLFEFYGDKKRFLWGDQVVSIRLGRLHDKNGTEFIDLRGRDRLWLHIEDPYERSVNLNYVLCTEERAENLKSEIASAASSHMVPQPVSAARCYIVDQPTLEASLGDAEFAFRVDAPDFVPAHQTHAEIANVAHIRSCQSSAEPPTASEWRAAAQAKKVLEIDDNCARAWNVFGSAGGGNVGGKNFTEVQYYEEALGIDDSYARAWYNLGSAGGGTVGGKQFTKVQCYEKAIEIDDSYAVAWNNLGFAGGGTVGGKKFTKVQCYEKALEIDDTNARAWNNLGSAGGGTVGGKQFTKVQCYEKVLEMVGECAFWWCENFKAVEGIDVSPGSSHSGSNDHAEAVQMVFNQVRKTSNSRACPLNGVVRNRHWTARCASV